MKISHTNHDFDAELRQLGSHLTTMGARCEQALRDAVAAFVNRDPSHIAELQALDVLIDRDEMELDDLAMRVLARRQPVAHDLRFLAVVLKFDTDLERIGDKAVGIAKRARDVAEPNVMPPHPEIAPMSLLAQTMLRGALDAFVEGDAEGAERVLARDDEVDQLHAKQRNRVVEWMGQHPEGIRSGLAVLAVARHLERVADHATNLAEQVVFLVRGDDVRHRDWPPASGAEREPR